MSDHGINKAALDAWITREPDDYFSDDDESACPACGELLDTDGFCSECLEYFNDYGEAICPECKSPLDDGGLCGNDCAAK